MPILPKSKYRIKETGGNTFFNSQGKYYKGPYIELNNGTFFAGNNPNDLYPSNQLYVNNPNALDSGKSNYVPYNRYSQNIGGLYDKLDNHFPLTATKTLPTPKNRQEGSYLRYFASRNNTNSYIEIDFESYNELNYGTAKHDHMLYDTGIIDWNINTEASEKNKETLSILSTSFPEIENFFTNLIEFQNLPEEQVHPQASVQNDIKGRFYIDGEEIPTNLPQSYAYAPLNKDKIGQKCQSCIYFKNNNCTKWMAEVRPIFWCKSWQSLIKPTPPGRPGLPERPPGRGVDRFGNPVSYVRPRPSRNVSSRSGGTSAPSRGRSGY